MRPSSHFGQVTVVTICAIPPAASLGGNTGAGNKCANRAQRPKIPAALASFEPGELRNPQRTAQAARACKGRTRNWEKSEDERCRGRAGLNRQLYVTALL